MENYMKEYLNQLIAECNEEENQNELYHHGIKGMKWGVRRYQNADGTLTAAGKKRYGVDMSGARLSVSVDRGLGGSYSEEQKARIQKEATKTLTKARRENEKSADLYNKSAEKQRKKAESTNITDEKEKYTQKANSYTKAAQKYMSTAKAADTYLSKINSGTVEAGRDYITNHTYSTNVVLDALGILNVRKTTEVAYK